MGKPSAMAEQLLYLLILRGIQTSLNNYLLKANFFSILTYGITNSSVTEQEVVFVLDLNDGEPEICVNEIYWKCN